MRKRKITTVGNIDLFFSPLSAGRQTLSLIKTLVRSDKEE
jgi:hypothetical protein